ncbi:MAG TPA: hypothetical protein VN577_23215 [Terriglobales bacterium]|nr:hypothetical protein [Terriglobales bacterium]
MATRKHRTGIVACAVLLLCVIASSAQTKPRIDFDRLLADFPNLPWDFEIRYVVKDAGSTDMLRIHYDGRTDLVRWNSASAGSLAQVCRSKMSRSDFRKLLDLFRKNKFNDLPTASESLVTVARGTQRIVSVRVGRMIVRKIDRGDLQSPELEQLETVLEQRITAITADSKATCEMEAVPAKP